MKVLYRCPYKIQPWMLAVITLVAVVLMVWVENSSSPAHQQAMQKAVSLNREGQTLIAQKKFELGLNETFLDGSYKDPMLGSWLTTPVTSVFGHLSAKQASINPHFAALVYQWLVESGVKAGDHVAVSASGSFPALNMAAYAALQTIGAKPLVILSLTASQWGANQPQMLWIDMGEALYQQGLVDFKPLAVSYGARNDLAENLTDEGIELLQDAIDRNGQPPLIYTESLLGNVEQKWQIFNQHAQAGTGKIKAFINIGGGKSSTGSSMDKKALFSPGLNLSLPPQAKAEIPALMWRFISTDVPVIHLSGIEKMVKANGLEKHQQADFYRQHQQKPLYALIAVLILSTLLAGAAIWTRKLDPQVSL